MTVVDDDVKVWVAARAAALDKPEFSSQDISDQLSKIFKADGKKLEKFATQQCVANVPGGAGKHYNYLFKVGPNKYRMWRSGDPIEYTHAGAPTSPDVGRVPPEYRALFAANRFPEGLKPAEQGRHEKIHSVGKAGAQAVMEKPSTKTGPATKGLMVDLGDLDSGSPTGIARKTIFDQLFLEFGRLGSRLEMKVGDLKGETFAIQHDKVAGTVKTHQNFTIVMPSGGLVSHQCDLLIELESPSRSLFIDIVEASARADQMKAHGFDALHVKRDKKQRYSILVFLRTPNGMLQEQAESIAHGYDFFFGADALDVKNSNKFYALKTQVLEWLNGKVKPGAAA